MKVSRPKIDEILIDDLVSGQLTGERYRAALRALEAEPAKWRECALAFLEEQALRTELRALAQGDINWGVDSYADRTTLVVTDRQVTPANKVNTSVSPKLHGSSSGFSSMLSTVALLLVSFSVGWMGSEVLAERERSAASDSSVSQAAQSPANAAPPITSTITPQYVVDQPGAYDRGIPRAIRELERDGRISFETFNVLYPTTLEDGSSALIPIQEIRLGRGRLESY
jgi:hypothetical protein